MRFLQIGLRRTSDSPVAFDLSKNYRDRLLASCFATQWLTVLSRTTVFNWTARYPHLDTVP